MKHKFSATAVGFIITVFCWITTATVVVPVLVFAPVGLTSEFIFEKVFGNSGLVLKTIVKLLFQSGLLILLVFWYFKKLNVDTKYGNSFNLKRLILFMILFLFIVQPLGLNIWTIVNWQEKGTGSFAFDFIKTFPLASLALPIIGMTIDIRKNK